MIQPLHSAFLYLNLALNFLPLNQLYIISMHKSQSLIAWLSSILAMLIKLNKILRDILYKRQITQIKNRIPIAQTILSLMMINIHIFFLFIIQLINHAFQFTRSGFLIINQIFLSNFYCVVRLLLLATCLKVILS